MDLLANILIGLAILIFIVVVRSAIVNYLKAKKALRQKLLTFWSSKAPELTAAVGDFQKLLTRENGYFSNHLLHDWKNQYETLYKRTKNVDHNNAALPQALIKTIDTFRYYFTTRENLRSDFNKWFVPEELKAFENLFQNVERRCLDEQQRIAIVTDEDNNLVIAGAGSGKTTTIVGKVKYLQIKHRVPPSDILLISFTNKSAASLAERIACDGLEAMTFHKFGLKVITDCEQVKPSIFDENQFHILLKRHFDELIKNSTYLKNLTSYFLDYLKPPRSQFDFKTQGDYIQFLKDQNFRSYKPISVSSHGIVTTQMEAVKSIEECKIANHLLFNGISYEYEKPYEFDTATPLFQQYKPDFTVTQGGKHIYIEHFGISITGDVPQFFMKAAETYETAKSRYWEKIEWARELHKQNRTVLIETYSYQFNDGSIYDHLNTQLLAAGIKILPLTDEEKWKKIQESAKDEIQSMISLCGTFITLLKSNNYTFLDLERKNDQIDDRFTRQRNKAFISVVKPLFDRYATELSQRKEIDFNDMINKAEWLIRTGQYKNKYKYIIVDEFQDISIGRYKLLQAIRATGIGVRLFCVGDDWQSIYRFSGSDIALFKNFQDYFGVTERSRIETTYRYSTPLLTLSNTFISKNPNQSRKFLRPINPAQRTNYFLKYSFNENQDDTTTLVEIFKEVLSSVTFTNNKSVLILGRYGFDLKRIKNEQNPLTIDFQKGTVQYSTRLPNGETRGLKATYMTVHKAKGTEADIVILLNCNSGEHGFPAGMSDDQVLNLLLSEADQFENGEERRLFYVAMTRAKEALYFVSDHYRKSKFIQELEAERINTGVLKCPECKTADLILRKKGIAKNGTPYNFYGCSNYLYGCNYTNTVFNPS